MTAALVDSEEYTIKPDNSTPSIDDSQWPLLLKNYNKRKSLFTLAVQSHARLFKLTMFLSARPDWSLHPDSCGMRPAQA
jgi:hypothetical protein